MSRVHSQPGGSKCSRGDGAGLGRRVYRSFVIIAAVSLLLLGSAPSKGDVLEEASYSIRQHKYAVDGTDPGFTTDLATLASQLRTGLSGKYYSTESDTACGSTNTVGCSTTITVYYPRNRCFSPINFTEEELPPTNPTSNQVIEATGRLTDLVYYDGYVEITGGYWEAWYGGNDEPDACGPAYNDAVANLFLGGATGTLFYPTTASVYVDAWPTPDPDEFIVEIRSWVNHFDYLIPTQILYQARTPINTFVMPTVGDVSAGSTNEVHCNPGVGQATSCDPNQTCGWRKNYILESPLYARLKMPALCRPLSFGTCQSAVCGAGIPRVGVHPADLYVTVVDTPISRASALGPGLELGMRYNQRYAPHHADGPFGCGWQWDYGGHIAKYGNRGAMQVELPGGTVIQFFHNDGTDDYTGPPSLGYELTEETNGTFRLEHEQGGGYGFLEPTNGVGQLAYIEDRFGNRVTLNYDDGLVTNITDAASNSFAVLYSASNLITAVTNYAGLGATFSYTNGMLTAVTDMGGHEYTYAYDGVGQGRITNIVTEAGATLIEYGNGFHIAVTDPAGNSRIYGMPETDGLARYQVNGRGHTNWTHYANTVKGMTAVREVDALGQETSYQLDDLGRRTAVTNALGQVVSRSVYGAHDNLLHQVDALGHTNSYLYSEDGLDRIASIDTLGYTNRYGYDADHNLVAMTNAAGGVFSYVYTDGLKTAETNAEGLVISYAYDGAGQLTQTVSSVGTTNSFAYDSLGRLWIETSTSALSVTNEYDGLNRLTSRTYPDGTAETYGYSCCGMTSQTNRRGYVTTHTYDSVGRRTSSTDVYSNTTTNHLDGNGNVTFTANALGFTVTTLYDELDRPEQVIYANPASNLYSELTYYDALGRVTNRVDRRGQDTTYLHDALGRVTNVLDGVGRSLETRTYDAGGRVWIRTDADGISVTNTYDAIGRPIKTTMPDGTYTENFYSYASNGLYKVRNRLGAFTWYTRDDAGRVTAVKDPEDRVTAYAYDAAGRMVKLTDAGGNETEFEYDLYGNLVEKTYDDGVSWEYAYDSHGNLTNAVNGREETIAYTYNAGDRPLSIDYPGDTDIAFAYDVLGRVTSRVDAAGTTFYGYGDLVHLTEVDGPFTNDTLTYTYDGDLKARRDPERDELHRLHLGPARPAGRGGQLRGDLHLHQQRHRHPAHPRPGYRLGSDRWTMRWTDSGSSRAS